MKKRTSIISIIFSFFLLIIGAMMLFIGLFSDHFTVAHHDGFKTVKATVIGYEYEELHNLQTPLFEYNYKGITYTSHFAVYSSTFEDQFPKGSVHKIKVNPNNPEEIRGKDCMDVILGEHYIAFLIGGAIVSTLGVIVLAIGIMSIVKNKRGK